MLIYESQGFIEVEAKNIKRINRSIATVCFGDSAQAGFNVHATLCEYSDGSQDHCSVAFYSKVLKRALVFSVKNPEKIPPFQHGEDILAELGFYLENVNLKLSPAMLEVVLLDVPGIASPDFARKLRNERALLLKELQKEIDRDPDGSAGKKSALKLATEKRLDERAEELQAMLTDLLSPQEIGDGYSAAMDQVKELTERLERAEKALDEERQQREMAESITSAAEKRIQELEELLVDVETKSASEIKQKQRVLQLKGRIKELEERLENAESELTNEKNNQEQFVEDVRSANEQIAALEEKLKTTEEALAQTLDRISEEEINTEKLQEALEKAELRADELESKLEGTVDNSQFDELKQSYAELQRHIEDAEGRLENSLREKGELRDQNNASAKIIEDLQARLDEAEKLQNVNQAEDEQINKDLQARLDKSEAELIELREELQRESSVRRRLERGATDDENRILELENALEEAKASNPLPESSVAENSDGLLESLKAEVHQLKKQLIEAQGGREDLERELDQAHAMIDSLERMVRKSAAEAGTSDSGNKESQQQIIKLESKLELLTEQLERERILHKEQLAAAASLPADGKGGPASKASQNEAPIDPDPGAAEPVKPVKQAKPLPHEIRPKPDPGEFFRPDWNLEGLPCQSEKQVFKAWETVFNVQIALDGYPSQYCMAFLVVLKLDKIKKVFMMFRLKQTKHTLVKVPAETPKNDNDLQKAISEGLKYLKSSGFDMEEMPREYIGSTLGSYFSK